ncbi:heavy-metal-associated domain-containing protein [Microbacterium sp. LRZ72]|uniref:heavy-metal-associated domain-containing protein n=1 Tax=Microbacterium sp. LRZ72 TaxID=2942481 RepID=UPI0029AAE407|nr:heavy-metal-associated domain-containing protein [Microbacterium sp. LRZ72]MDX2377566.1 heavy-metal-associated domain-containing protein [Microbacterium sp. LRZ72]
MATEVFQVVGMSCGHCESSVREQVAQMPEVDAVEVSATTGALTVSSSAPLDTSAVVAAVARAGYQAAPA